MKKNSDVLERLSNLLSHAADLCMEVTVETDCTHELAVRASELINDAAELLEQIKQ